MNNIYLPLGDPDQDFALNLKVKVKAKHYDSEWYNIIQDVMVSNETLLWTIVVAG